ncbi:hypothetical protein MRX96_040187 [Rhipicephalus microplus]
MTEVVDLIGHFGPWQACLVAYITYRGILTGLNNLAYVFLVTDNEHWCSRPTLPDGLLANVSEAEWKERFIPYDNVSGSHSQCSMYGLLQNSTNGEIVPDYTSLKSCEAWTYDEHVFGHTMTDEWNLVCENTWKRSLIQSTYMACLMLGILVIGNVSDRIVSLFSTICLCASSFALTFSSSLTFFLVGRVGVAVAISGLQVACFSLLAETIGPKFRIALNVCYGYGWISGLLLLPGIVWLAQDWRKLLIVQAAFAAPLLCALPWLYESPRWLVKHVEKEVDSLMKRKQNAMQGHQSNVSVIGLFKTKYLRKKHTGASHRLVSFLHSVLRVCEDIYYARRNPYLNFGIAAGLDLTLLITAFTPREYMAVRTTIRMTGWFTYTLGYTTQFVFINEMFPTVARSGGFGLCTTVGRLGGCCRTLDQCNSEPSLDNSVRSATYASIVAIAGLFELLSYVLLVCTSRLSKKMKTARRNRDSYNVVETEDREAENKI